MEVQYVYNSDRSIHTLYLKHFDSVDDWRIWHDTFEDSVHKLSVFDYIGLFYRKLDTGLLKSGPGIVSISQDKIILYLFFILIGIHSMQGWTATKIHGVTRKEAQKILQDTETCLERTYR